MDRKESNSGEWQEAGKGAVEAGGRDDPPFSGGTGLNPEEPAAAVYSGDDLGAMEEDAWEEETTRRRPVWLRIVAFFTILAFLGLVAATSWPASRGQLLELVLNSVKLQRDIDANLLKAVVQINVIYQKHNAPFTAEQKSGSGFNIDPRGVIVTNHHVVDGALNIMVIFPDGKIYPALRYSSRPEYDLAVLALGAEGLPTVPLSAAGQPDPGDRIRVVGNPLTLNNIVVEGKVGQYLLVGSKQDRVFSLDAPIYPGNSGSPVFDRNDHVVGVVFGTLKGSEKNGEKPSGLAIPIREVLELSRVMTSGS